MSEKKIPSSPDYGNQLGHQIFYFVLRYLGPRPAYFVLFFVIFYYAFVLRRPRRLASHYLRRRFPQDGPVRRLLRSYVYLYRFGQVLIDQAAIGILGRQAFKIDFPGQQELYEISARKKGLVLLTSHIGNWKTAMSAVDDLAVPVNFLIRLEAHMDGRHFFDLSGQRNRIKVIDPAGYLGGLVQAVAVLEKGECVSIMGDRAWGARTRKCSFLGQEAAFPISPYHLVSVTGADLVMLVAVRTGPLAFKIDFFYLSREVDFSSWSRERIIDHFLEKYVAALDEYTRRYPYMWFNFFDFWNPDKVKLEQEAT